jgi:site-specific recombinase
MGNASQLAVAVAAGAVGGGAVAIAAMWYLSRKNPALVLTRLERNVFRKVLYRVSFTS